MLNREEQRLLHTKQNRGKTGVGLPSDREGSNGDIWVREVNGKITLCAKYNNTWRKFTEDTTSVAMTITPTVSQTPDYDSGWFSVTTAQTYDKTFGWTVTADTLPTIVKITWSDDATPVIGTDPIWEVQAGQYYYSSSSRGMNCYIEYSSSTVIRLHTGDNYTMYSNTSGGDGILSSGGYYKLEVWK